MGTAVMLAETGAMITLQGAGDEVEIDNLVHVKAARYDVTIRHDKAHLSDSETIRAMMHRTARSPGSVDILVNSVCVQHLAPIESFPEAKWDAILAVNLSAVSHATRACRRASNSTAGAVSSISPRRTGRSGPPFEAPTLPRDMASSDLRRSVPWRPPKAALLAMQFLLGR